jgi:modulator of FtsH protease HflK
MRWRLLLGLLLAGYLASGFYLVGGADKAVVRRFGQQLPTLRWSGLWWDAPWPFSRIDRINTAAVRTLTIGDPAANGDELLPALRSRPGAVLTGDSNLLHVRASVQYHVWESRIADFLYRHQSVEAELRLLLEAAVTEAAAHTGVDDLQTLGLAMLNLQLTERLRGDAARLGVEIDQVTLDRVDPPVLVQADFLDVSNARADAAQARHRAQTAGEQRQAAATAAAQQLLAEARTDAQATRTTAQADADRFQQLTAQIAADAAASGRTYAESRRLAEQRLTTDALSAALSQVRRRWLFDAADPVILNLRPAD